MILLEAVVGSKAYGLDHAGSDTDYLGIFAYPTDTFWSLSQPEQTFVHKNPDRTMHEIGKYLNLALKCNPTVLELMYLDDYIIKTDFGEELIAMRSSFLSEDYVRNAFGGYARQQLIRLKQKHRTIAMGFNLDEVPKLMKHARHCLRLINQGQELLSTGTMTVRVNPEDYFMLNVSYDIMIKKLEEKDSELKDVQSVLPKEPDRRKVERFLYNVRKSLTPTDK